MPKYSEKERAKPYSPLYREWKNAKIKGNEEAAEAIASRHTKSHLNTEPDWDAMRARILAENRRESEIG